jgi:chaperonin GroES
MTDATKWKPTADRLLIQRIDADDVSEGGIIIPENAKKKPDRGHILAVGPDVSDEVAVGDEVLFAKYAGHVLGEGDVSVLLMHEHELIAKVVS